MIVHLMFASTLGQIFKPLYELLAGIIAFFYSIIPNFAVSIALLTVVVMIVTAPLTVKSTRSTIKMQRVAPELKKIQAKYKGDRVTLNEEMMKLYKEHGINPAGGCLPMLIQLPVFVVLYGVIRGLTNTVKVAGHTVARPLYVSHDTRLYHDLVISNGHMGAFGLDLGDNLFSPRAHWYGAIPYAIIVAIAIGLQYLQMRQLNSRNPGAAQANPQMQMMQRYMPLIFAVIYIRISAAVNIYFIVSSLCRIGIQEGIFRSGVLDKKSTRGEGKLPGRGGGTGAPRRTIVERLADAQQRALEQQKSRQAGLQPEIEMPRPPQGGASKDPNAKPPPTSAGNGSTTKPAGTKPSPGKPNETQTKGSVSSNGGSTPDETSKTNGAAKPGGATKRPGGAGNTQRPSGASTNGGAQRGSTKAGSNGSPASKEQPQGQPRSAKKRPRKAR
jgi:YidC/Oxa1 family membrane protein insertase